MPPHVGAAASAMRFCDGVGGGFLFRIYSQVYTCNFSRVFHPVRRFQNGVAHLTTGSLTRP